MSSNECHLMNIYECQAHEHHLTTMNNYITNTHQPTLTFSNAVKKNIVMIGHAKSLEYRQGGGQPT